MTTSFRVADLASASPRVTEDKGGGKVLPQENVTTEAFKHFGGIRRCLRYSRGFSAVLRTKKPNTNKTNKTMSSVSNQRKTPKRHSSSWCQSKTLNIGQCPRLLIKATTGWGLIRGFISLQTTPNTQLPSDPGKNTKLGVTGEYKQNRQKAVPLNNWEYRLPARVANSPPLNLM